MGVRVIRYVEQPPFFWQERCAEEGTSWVGTPEDVPYEREGMAGCFFTETTRRIFFGSLLGLLEFFFFEIFSKNDDFGTHSENKKGNHSCDV